MNLKDTFAVTAIVVVAIIFDAIMDNADIPITFADVFLVSISMLIIYVPFSAFFIKHKLSSKRVVSDRVKPAWLTIFSGLLLFLGVGVSAIYLGLEDPWELYSGVKAPPTHGYTILLLGIVMTGIGLMFGYYFLLLGIKKFTNSRSEK